MEIIRTSQMTGNIYKIDLPITPEQLVDFSKGVNPEDAFPNLTKDQIRFFMTGIIPEELNGKIKSRNVK